MSAFVPVSPVEVNVAAQAAYAPTEPNVKIARPWTALTLNPLVE